MHFDGMPPRCSFYRTTCYLSFDDMVIWVCFYFLSGVHSYAGLHSTVVTGYAKGVDYKPGMAKRYVPAIALSRMEHWQSIPAGFTEQRL